MSEIYVEIAPHHPIDIFGLEEEKLNRIRRYFPYLNIVLRGDLVKAIGDPVHLADFEKKLVWKTNEGFKVQPFYRKEDIEGLKTTDGLPGTFPYVRGNKKDDNTWFIRQDIRVEDPKEANRKALDILNKGVDSLGFKIKAKDLNTEYIRTLLNDICCECIELNFSTCQRHNLELAKLLADYFKEKNYDPAKLQGSLDFDPISRMMKKGKDTSVLIKQAKELVETLAPFPKFRCISVNANALNNAGAYIYQELGYALSWGNEYLNQLTEAGVPAALAAKKIKYFSVMGGDFKNPGSPEYNIQCDVKSAQSGIWQASSTFSSLNCSRPPIELRFHSTTKGARHMLRTKMANADSLKYRTAGRKKF